MEMVLAIALSIVIFLAYSMYMAQPIYSPNYEEGSLEELAKNIVLKLQSTSDLDNIISGLFSGDPTSEASANATLANTIRPLLPPGVYCNVSFYPYNLDPITGNWFFNATAAKTVIIGSPTIPQTQTVFLEKASGEAVYTASDLNIYLIVVTLFRVR